MSTTISQSSTTTIDGAPAPAAFVTHIEAQYAAHKAAIGCRPCGSVLYRHEPHGPTCPLLAAPAPTVDQLEAASEAARMACEKAENRMHAITSWIEALDDADQAGAHADLADENREIGSLVQVHGAVVKLQDKLPVLRAEIAKLTLIATKAATACRAAYQAEAAAAPKVADEKTWPAT